MSRGWHVHGGTDGCEGPYGTESVSKPFTGIVCQQEHIHECSCANLLDLVNRKLTYGGAGERECTLVNVRE